MLQFDELVDDPHITKKKAFFRRWSFWKYLAPLSICLVFLATGVVLRIVQPFKVCTLPVDRCDTLDDMSSTSAVSWACLSHMGFSVQLLQLLFRHPAQGFIRSFETWRWFLFVGALGPVFWFGSLIVHTLANAVLYQFFTTRNVVYFVVAIRVIARPGPHWLMYLISCHSQAAAKS